MLPFKKCPVCGGEMIEKDVEKLLRGGKNTAILNVQAEVCLHCGERLYSKETISRFEKIRDKLARQDVSDFQPLGQSFQVKN
jgi:YgiT-type zinc finger domain-containing protein